LQSDNEEFDEPLIPDLDLRPRLLILLLGSVEVILDTPLRALVAVPGLVPVLP
jgi:hypothetical protein